MIPRFIEAKDLNLNLLKKLGLKNLAAETEVLLAAVGVELLRILLLAAVGVELLRILLLAAVGGSKQKRGHP